MARPAKAPIFSDTWKARAVPSGSRFFFSVSRLA
jgi:hypothetical protein